MTKLTIAAAQEATELAKRRQTVAIVRWHLTGLTNKSAVTGFNAGTPFEPDEPLAWALEEFRARQLAEIDASLAKLGFEPPKPEPEPEPRETPDAAVKRVWARVSPHQERNR